MMYKKKKGFSLAELLISLLIISIVLAAAIPTITKRNSAGSEKIWHWSGANNSIYSAIGANQSVMIGTNQMPHRENLGAAGYYGNFFEDGEIDIPNTAAGARPFFTTDGDKLVLLKRSLYLDNENQTDNFLNSHISFYNLENSSSATTRDITYAGRIASDQHNLAFGIGTLQQLRTADRGAAGNFKGYNTAIGHYSLFYNTFGSRNTAIGEKTLTYNLEGSDNTALGYSALKAATTSGNTAIGAGAIQTNDEGEDNTAVGNAAYKFDSTGSRNTAIGSGACSFIKGSNNICIGYAAGGKEWDESKGIPSDSDLIAVDNYLIIGNDENGAPLVEGNISHGGSGANAYDKEVNINARYFNVNPFDASTPIFQVVANSGTGAYGEVDDVGKGYVGGNNQAKYGQFRFTFKDTFGGSNDALQLQLSGISNNVDREVRIAAVDPYHDGANINFADFNINDMLFILMPEDGTGSSSSGGGKPLRINSNDNIGLSLQNETISIDNGTKLTMAFTKDYGFSLKEVNSSGNIVGSMFIKDGYTILAGSTLELSGSTKVYMNTDETHFGGSGNNDATVIIKSANDGSEDVIINRLEGAAYNYAKSKSVVTSIVKLDSKLKEVADQVARLGSVPSDARLKNISGDNKAGLKEINALEVKNYTYKNDKDKTPHVGVIAQQLQKIFPNSVFKDDDGYLKIRTEEIFYAMVNSIKELFIQVQDIAAKVTGLDKRITELEAQNKLLKKQNEEFEKRLTKLEKQYAK